MAISRFIMTQWIGDNWRLKAGPQLGPMNSNKQAEGTTTESDPELRYVAATKNPLSKNTMVSKCIIIKADISISARKSILGLSMNTVWSSTRNVGTSLSMRT